MNGEVENMTATIIEGKKVQLPLLKSLQEEVLEHKKNNIVPGMAIIMVDNGELLTRTNYALHVNLASQLGYLVKEKVLSKDITEEELIHIIEGFNRDESIDGIIVLIPLPDSINVVNVINAIDPDKEIEGLHPLNAIGLFPTSNSPVNVPMCVTSSVLKVFDYHKINLNKKNIVILIDWSFLTSNPIATMVAKMGSLAILPPDVTIKIINTNTENLEEHCKEADVLIVSTEQVDLVKGNWIKPGACVVDFNPIQVGVKESNLHPGRKLPILKGSVEIESVKEVAKWIAPAAGGVGPVMLTMLMENVLNSSKRRHYNKMPIL